MKLIRKAWFRIVKVVMMPDDVMGIARVNDMTHRNSASVPAGARYLEGGASRSK